MYATRDPEERIDRYTGPYERWVFSEELGRPYAFPAIRHPDARHMAAVLEGPGDPRDMKQVEVRLPPLWPSDATYAVTPFLFRNTSERPVDQAAPDRELARCLSSIEETESATRFRLNIPVDGDSWVGDYTPDASPANWRTPVVNPRAIIGVIDDGLPFAHRSFDGADGGTRISHIWLQSARADQQDRVPVGRELTNGDIDALRDQFGADERRLYRSVGAIDGNLPEIGGLLNRSGTHGAHILGLAAGNGPHVPGPDLGDDIQIIAVQLPNTVAWDTSGFGKEMFMLSALHYIFARADEVAKLCGCSEHLPVVINFSYGWNAGPHDGGSSVETAIEELLRRRCALQPASAIVMPTGNTFADNLHAQFTSNDMSPNGARIGWRLPPGDRSSSYLEAWLPEGFDPTGWVVRLHAPLGHSIDAGAEIAISPDTQFDPVGDPRRFAEIEMNGQNVGQISVDLHRGTRWRIMIAMIPTTETATGRRLPSGLWHIEIDHRNGAGLNHDQSIDIWVQRDDDPSLLGMGGRQSQLEGATGIVRGYGSLSAVATTPSATRVAGHIGGRFVPTRYSSAGGLKITPLGDRLWGVQPDFAAAADQIIGLPGLRSIGTVTGSTAWLTGTSAASALAARWMVSNAAHGLDLKNGLIPLPLVSSDVDEHRQTARLGAGAIPIGYPPKTE